jgi:predicted membrane-bound spermidine synthase/polyferredoxin/Na+-translocating ferredoxin:NAD+ oxidoreductase RnfG subunit
MRFTRRLMIFSYGLFTIAAQALLFREFITTFEGNDISVGIFFASWFLWVGLGAIIVYKAEGFAEKLLENVEFWLLCYLPAFILELFLIIYAREMAGLEAYALLSIRAVVLLAIVVNAPVSVITGMLFPVLCRWIQQDQKLPVSGVYITEAAGSFLGGLGVTVFLSFGLSLAKIFLILAFILSTSVFLVELAAARQNSKLKIRACLAFLLPVCILLCLFFGIDKPLMRSLRIVKWKKLLPSSALIGSFQTAQAEYLYGIYEGQWIAVRQGSVCEALPDETAAGRIAAIGLCQNPQARRVLVIGSGLGLCRQLLRLPQIENVTWTHCDNEYVRKVEEFIPAELRISDRRFYRHDGDVRSLLEQRGRYYDLVILNLPDATSSVLNRYYTQQFYSLLKESLRPDGVLAVRIAGGENIMGTELINLGASTELTLEKVFSRLVLVPGEDTWFIVSDSESLTGDPGILRDRFAAIPAAGDIFPPAGLLSIYLPDRANLALKWYSSADLPQDLLVNRDSRPLTHLYSLLLAAKQSGAPVARFVKLLALAGPLVFFIPVLVFVVLRLIYILRMSGRGSPGSFDSTFLVFSAGAVSIGIVIVLMYLYQTRFGSLYLYIGVISSLFMVGLTAGAGLISYLLGRRSSHESRVTSYVFVVILVYAMILGVIIFWPAESWTHLIFGAAFVMCGLCTGCYFPLAARQLADSEFETGQAGSKLETADHLGACAGGLLTSLVLVPVLGTALTLIVFILLLVANVPAAVLQAYGKQRFEFPISDFKFRLRRLGYVLFGVGVTVILCSNLLAAAAARMQLVLPKESAQALAGQLRLEQTTAFLPDNAQKIRYFRTYADKGKLTGYIFSSQELAPEVRGFGGTINLAIYVDTSGRLIDFHIVQSNETPAYLELLDRWSESLSGRRLFQSDAFADVDTVTGATVSSEAVLSALQKSGQRFAAQVLGLSGRPSLEAGTRWSRYLPDTRGIYLIVAFAVALIVIYRGGFWTRLAVLLLNLLVGGIILNAQYSTEQIATALSLYIPSISLSGMFLLIVGIPFLVIIFGNIYCGYICPFGAVQELLGYVLPERFKGRLSAERMQGARFVKYVILFVLVIVFFASRNRTTLAADPLISIFNLRFTLGDFQTSVLLIAAIALVGSIFYTRFWCRYLCPVGAFLSLLNNIAILNRFLPAKRFGRCEFGLTPKDQTDCLYCDRCRYSYTTVRPEVSTVRHLTAPLSRYFIVVVVVMAIFVSAISIRRFLQVIPAGFEQAAVYVPSGAGQPRNVDMQRIRNMIRQKKLSDKEAEFYRKIE